jgi:hypothetical protein
MIKVILLNFSNYYFIYMLTSVVNYFHLYSNNLKIPLRWDAWMNDIKNRFLNLVFYF